MRVCVRGGGGGLNLFKQLSYPGNNYKIFKNKNMFRIYNRIK